MSSGQEGSLKEQLTLVYNIIKNTYASQSKTQKQRIKYFLIFSSVTTTGVGLWKLYNKIFDKTVPEQKTKNINKIDKKFIKRLSLLISIAVPSFKSKEFGQLLLLAIIVVCRTLVSNRLSALSGEISRALLLRNFEEFAGLLKVSTSISVISSLLAPSLQFLIDKSSIEWRVSITKYIHELYLDKMMYYKTAYLNTSVKNPDQVVTQDVQKFSEGMCGLFASLVKPIADLSIYTFGLVRLTGWIGPVLVSSYMFLSWIFITVIRPNFAKLTAIDQNLQGNYRYCHVRTVTNGESIAFLGGDTLEKEKADEAFDRLYQHQKKILRRTWRFNIFNEFVAFNLPESICWLISALPVFFGHLSDVSRGELSRELRYLAAVVTHEFHAIGEIIKLRTRLSEISGYTNNVSELIETIENLDHTTKKSKIEAGEIIKFEGIDLATPAGKILAKDVTFEIPKGKNILVTGPNASGKTSLFRLLAGLWHFGTGKITKPSNKPGFFDQIYFVPQKPYNVTGTLRDQISYPNNDNKAGDEEISELLKTVKIEKIIEREGFDEVKNWDDILSLGEQQRLSMARLFYHKPKYAILDECTSAVSVDIEKNLYERARKLGITCITISLKPALAAYHDYELNMDGKGTWTLKPIQHE